MDDLYGLGGLGDYNRFQLANTNAGDEEGQESPFLDIAHGLGTAAIDWFRDLVLGPNRPPVADQHPQTFVLPQQQDIPPPALAQTPAPRSALRPFGMGLWGLGLGSLSTGPGLTGPGASWRPSQLLVIGALVRSFQNRSIKPEEGSEVPEGYRGISLDRDNILWLSPDRQGEMMSALSNLMEIRFEQARAQESLTAPEDQVPQIQEAFMSTTTYFLPDPSPILPTQAQARRLFDLLNALPGEMERNLASGQSQGFRPLAIQAAPTFETRVKAIEEEFGDEEILEEPGVSASAAYGFLCNLLEEDVEFNQRPLFSDERVDEQLRRFPNTAEKAFDSMAKAYRGGRLDEVMAEWVNPATGLLDETKLADEEGSISERDLEAWMRDLISETEAEVNAGGPEQQFFDAAVSIREFLGGISREESPQSGETSLSSSANSLQEMNINFAACLSEKNNYLEELGFLGLNISELEKSEGDAITQMSTYPEGALELIQRLNLLIRVTAGRREFDQDSQISISVIDYGVLQEKKADITWYYNEVFDPVTGLFREDVLQQTQQRCLAKQDSGDSFSAQAPRGTSLGAPPIDWVELQRDTSPRLPSDERVDLERVTSPDVAREAQPTLHLVLTLRPVARDLVSPIAVRQEPVEDDQRPLSPEVAEVRVRPSSAPPVLPNGALIVKPPADKPVEVLPASGKKKPVKPVGAGAPLNPMGTVSTWEKFKARCIVAQKDDHFVLKIAKVFATTLALIFFPVTIAARIILHFYDKCFVEQIKGGKAAVPKGATAKV